MVWRSICKLALVTAIAMAAWAGAAMAQEIVFIPNRVIYPGETITMDALKEVTLKPGRTDHLGRRNHAAAGCCRRLRQGTQCR